MNEHRTAPTCSPTPEEPAQPAPMRLQSLDLGALGVEAPADVLVCDIDDPDCEVPAPASEEHSTPE